MSVRRILMGVPVDEAADRAAADVESLVYFVTYARRQTDYSPS